MEFNEEQRMLQDMVERFCRENVQPLAAQIDREERFPSETFEQMAGLGLLGVGIPEAFGGSGGGVVEECILAATLSRYCMSTAASWGAHVDLCAANIHRNGSEEQHERFLRPLASGEKIGGMAMTEPEAGSDVLNMKLRAEDKGDHFLLNGTKTLITNGPVGDLFLVYAKTDMEARGRGITAFVVEKEFEGFVRGPQFEKLGWHGSPTGELIFEDCPVPKENVIGRVHEGLGVLLSGLNSERLVLAAESLGLAEACLEDTVRYSRERVQFGRPIGQFQSVTEKVARMAARVEAMKAMVWSLAFRMADHGPQGMALEAASAKLMTSEMALQNALDATQVFGGYGYIREFPVERYLRDVRLMTIGGGTSEIMCQVIQAQLNKR